MLPTISAAATSDIYLAAEGLFLFT